MVCSLTFQVVPQSENGSDARAPYLPSCGSGNVINIDKDIGDGLREKRERRGRMTPVLT
jgi:hypothetical protein